MTTRPLRLAMVGGGEGAFIGAIHRAAAALDGDWRLVAGAFSSDADRNRRSGEMLAIAPDRTYASLEAMLLAEAALPVGVRVDAVAVVTPNHLHAPWRSPRSMRASMSSVKSRWRSIWTRRV